MNFVVLSTSRGTVFESTLNRISDGSLSAKCLGLITDRADRGCIEKARTANLPVKIVPIQKDEPREDYDKRLDQAILDLVGSQSSKLIAHSFIIACQGWMRILSPWFVRKWRNRILNVHPSLLPNHKGAHAHELVLKSGDNISGMTVHMVEESVDTGKILLQKSCPVRQDDTEETLKARIQELEKEWYPRVLEMIERGEIRLPE